MSTSWDFLGGISMASLLGLNFSIVFYKCQKLIAKSKKKLLEITLVHNNFAWICVA